MREPSRRSSPGGLAIVAMVAALAGVYCGYEFERWMRARREAETARAAVQQQKEKAAADFRQQQIEIEEAERRKQLADKEAEARRKDEADAEEKRRTAGLEEARRKIEEARRKVEADAEAKRRIAALEEARRKNELAAEEKLREERRIAAQEETRRNEEMRKEDERLRLASVPSDEQRAEFVRRIQEVLKRNGCYNGALNGRSDDAQEGVNKFVRNARRKDKTQPGRIELDEATVGDFESWLKDADAIKERVCSVAIPKLRQSEDSRREKRERRKEEELRRKLIKAPDAP